VTFRQAGYWQDSVTLWQRTVDVTADNYRAQTNLRFRTGRGRPAQPGDACVSRTRCGDRARTRTTNTARCSPTWATSIGPRPNTRRCGCLRFAEAHNSLGLTRVNQDRVDDGIREFTAALAIDPDSCRRATTWASPTCRTGATWRFRVRGSRAPATGLGGITGQSRHGAGRRRAQARRSITSPRRRGSTAIRSALHYAWGGVLMDLGDMPGAIEHFQTVLSISPSYAPAVHDLGLSFAHPAI
jgi:tetratricopeptide (TPR) repeat protein